MTLPVGEGVDVDGEEVGGIGVDVDGGGLVGFGGLVGLTPRVHLMEHLPPLESPLSSVIT